jgi:hypothetical protein
MNEPEAAELRGGGRIVAGAAIAAAVGIALLIGGAFVDGRRTLLAYLASYNFVVSTAVGALIFLMICHAMNAGWPTLLRRLTEAMVSLLPLCVLLFIPILAGMPVLYPWMRPEAIADPHVRHVVAERALYLNPLGFVGRAAAYFAVWIFVGFLLRRWSRPRDAAAAATSRDRMFALSGALLPLVGLSISFAAFDWAMTLMPEWYSTMFPVRYFAGGFLGALALLTVLTAAADRAGLVPGVNDSHYYALGRLLLSFVIFWAYTEFFQLMLIWIANKPDEVTFYLARARGGFLALSVVVALAQFVIPFFVLLSYDLKRRREPLAAVAAWILAAHYLDAHWLVIPSGDPRGAAYHWIDLGALLAVGGAAVAYGVLRLRGERLVPVHDPRLPEAIRYESV